VTLVVLIASIFAAVLAATSLPHILDLGEIEVALPAAGALAGRLGPVDQSSPGGDFVSYRARGVAVGQ